MLVVEDDDRVGSALCSVLTRHGFDVRRAGTGEQALAGGADTDVVLLDLGLPDADGFEVGERLRHLSDVPIIMVTARSEMGDRLRGLSVGADDYLTKPYDLRELIARIHAVTRRAQHSALPAQRAGTVTFAGGVELDFDARTVRVDGRSVLLTRKEFEVLAVLARAPGIAVRREQLMGAVWNTSWKGTERTLEVHVASLRAKLGVPEAIVTVRGVGYRVLA